MMSGKTKALAIAAMMLNLFDAWATLFIISKGGIEINPVMAYAIEVGPWFFVTVKVVLFTLAIIIMVRRIPKFLKWVVGWYGLLALWHCYLLWNIYLFSLGQLTSGA